MLVTDTELVRDLTARPLQAGQVPDLSGLGGQLGQGAGLCLSQFGFVGHDSPPGSIWAVPISYIYYIVTSGPKAIGKSKK